MGRSTAGDRCGDGARRRALRVASLAPLAALLAAPTAVAERGAPPALHFERHGEPVATEPLAALERIHAPVVVRVLEPYERREVPFRAIPFPAVLDAVYSASWRDEEELVFTCLDGYEPGVPVARVLEHSSFLAFARADQDDFAIRKRESGREQRIEVGPFYLVWANLDDAEVRVEGDYGWPYQLTGVDLVRTRERFPHMAPPDDAPVDVERGFRAFRIYCSRCHRVNGDGGTIGPELVTPISPLDYRDRDWLRRWIADPSALVPTSRMPGLDPQLADRERTIDDVLAYLVRMVAQRDASAEAADGR